MRKWDVSGNPKIRRCHTWTISTSLFSLKWWGATVLYSSSTSKKWHLQTRFGEHASHFGMSWALPQFLRLHIDAPHSVKNFAHKGTNTFIYMHYFHSGVRNSFSDTPDGVKPKVNVLDWLLYMIFKLIFSICVPSLHACNFFSLVMGYVCMLTIFFFGDEFYYIHTFCTRGYIELVQ